MADLHTRIAHRFARAAVRERAGRCLAGPLGRVERENGWQVAEAIGETGPRGGQRLLSAAVWDAEGVRDALRASVVDHLGDQVSGVLIVDDTGFVKKGTRSCGVACRYTGTVGDTAAARVGVLLAYASTKGTAFSDRALYLPRIWPAERERRRGAGIPAEVRLATRIALARRMLERAGEAAVPARWVVADAFSGRSHASRRWREARGAASALMVPKTPAVPYRGRRPTAAKLAERLPTEAGAPLPRGSGVRAERRQRWARLPLSEDCPPARRRWLLVQRSADDASDLAYHLAYGPEAPPAEELRRVCGSRGQIEEGFAQAKGELGLDHDEVRKGEAWHRFVTLCLLAHADLAIMRLAAQQEEAAAAAEKGASIPACSRSLCRRSAGLCWRWPRVVSAAPSAPGGRCGDEPIKRPPTGPPAPHPCRRAVAAAAGGTPRRGRGRGPGAPAGAATTARCSAGSGGSRGPVRPGATCRGSLASGRRPPSATACGATPACGRASLRRGATTEVTHSSRCRCRATFVRHRCRGPRTGNREPRGSPGASARGKGCR